MSDEVLLRVDGLEMHFPVRGGILNRVVSHVHALNGVSFGVERGEILGVVGESGCGKSTLGKCLVRLHEPTGGEFTYDGKELLVSNMIGAIKVKEGSSDVFRVLVSVRGEDAAVPGDRPFFP